MDAYTWFPFFKDKEGKPVMKFDVIVGNPPYNNGKHQIYPLFYIWARNNCDRLSMIFPSGWQDAKNKHGLSIMNKIEIKYDKQIVSIDNLINVFKGVTGAKNTNIIYWKKGYDNGLGGKQLIYTDGENPEEIKFNISKDEIKRIPEILKLVDCVKNKLGDDFSAVDKITSGNRVYGLSAKFFKNPIEYGLPNTLKMNKKNNDDIRIFGAIDRENVIRFVDKDYPLPNPSKSAHIGVWKVFIPNGWGGMSGKYIGGTYAPICIANKTDISTASYLESGYCKNFDEVKKHSKYIFSKFTRALLMDNKFTHNNTTTSWKSVPIQDYTEDFWNSDNIDDIDEGLFEKYDVPEDIRKFVRDNIQPRSIKNIIGYNGEKDYEKLEGSIIDDEPDVSKSNLIPSESDFKQMKEDSKKLEPDEFNKKRS